MAAVSRLEYQFHIVPVSRAYLDPPVRGTDGFLIVKTPLIAKVPCGFLNCYGLRGAPKIWPNYRTPTCVRHAVQGCFWGLFGGGGPGAFSQTHTNPEQGGRRITPEQLHYTRESNSKNLVNYITPGKLIQKQLKSVSVSEIFGKLI